jgi:hypothetical protein
MSQYEALFACYCSGQMSERQWQEHLRDLEFAAYVRKAKEQKP